jgi:hypothetical protein
MMRRKRPRSKGRAPWPTVYRAAVKRSELPKETWTFRGAPTAPDQSCPTCHNCLRDAQAYDQIADRMLQATRPLTTARPSRPTSLVNPEPVAGKEAGQ